MQDSEILDTIRATLAAVTRIDPARVVPDACWEDIGADRFDFWAVLKDIQRQYGFRVPDEDAFSMDRVGDLIGFVEARRK